MTNATPAAPGERTPGWIGVDLDGTLAEYHGWVAPDSIGKPIEAMVARVKSWLAEGKHVRIFTARGSMGPDDRAIAYPAISDWCVQHLGCVVPITNVKDVDMIALFDDRAWRVVPNMGFVDAIEPWCVASAALAVSKGFSAKENIYRSLSLIHGEISEAVEELRKNEDPHHAYHRESDGKPEGFAYELADVFLRIANLCGELGIDLGSIVARKHAFNATRPHKHGKKF